MSDLISRQRRLTWLMYRPMPEAVAGTEGLTYPKHGIMFFLDLLSVSMTKHIFSSCWEPRDTWELTVLGFLWCLLLWRRRSVTTKSWNRLFCKNSVPNDNIKDATVLRDGGYQVLYTVPENPSNAQIMVSLIGGSFCRLQEAGAQGEGRGIDTRELTVLRNLFWLRNYRIRSYGNSSDLRGFIVSV